jgi:hypothetical protein
MSLNLSAVKLNAAVGAVMAGRTRRLAMWRPTQRHSARGVLDGIRTKPRVCSRSLLSRVPDRQVCSYWLDWPDTPLSIVDEGRPSSIEDHVKRESPAALLEMHRALGLWLNRHYV